MRYIKKGITPTFFEEWKSNFRKYNNKEPSYHDLRGDDYHRLKTHIIEEQYGLCCYCCKRIDHYNSHIEHFVPQSKGMQYELDYNNLLVSCNGYKDKCENCGHKKNNWYDIYYTISPLIEDCETFFVYTINGEIIANHSDTRAVETINKLDLNSYLLQKARNRVIFLSGIFDDDFSESRKIELIQYYNSPQNSKLENFCPSVIYCLQNYT